MLSTTEDVVRLRTDEAAEAGGDGWRGWPLRVVDFEARVVGITWAVMLVECSGWWWEGGSGKVVQREWWCKGGAKVASVPARPCPFWPPHVLFFLCKSEFRNPY